MQDIQHDKHWRYQYLLDLALEQLRAIESGDKRRLDLVLGQKWSLIRSLSGTRELMKTDPAVRSIIERVQEADARAEALLRERMGTVREQLVQMNKRRSARRIYSATAKKKHPILGLDLDDATPRFFDIQS